MEKVFKIRSNFDAPNKTRHGITSRANLEVSVWLRKFLRVVSEATMKAYIEEAKKSSLLKKTPCLGRFLNFPNFIETWKTLGISLEPSGFAYNVGHTLRYTPIYQVYPHVLN